MSLSSYSSSPTPGPDPEEWIPTPTPTPTPEPADLSDAIEPTLTSAESSESALGWNTVTGAASGADELLSTAPPGGLADPYAFAASASNMLSPYAGAPVDAYSGLTPAGNDLESVWSARSGMDTSQMIASNGPITPPPDTTQSTAPSAPSFTPTSGGPMYVPNTDVQVQKDLGEVQRDGETQHHYLVSYNGGTYDAYVNDMSKVIPPNQIELVPPAAPLPPLAAQTAAAPLPPSTPPPPSSPPPQASAGSDLPFYFPPEKGDVLPLMRSHDFGNAALNYSFNWIFAMGNLTNGIVNLPGELLARGEDAARAVGFSETDIQAAKDLSMVGELGSLVSGARAAGIETEAAFGGFLRTPNVLGADAIANLPQGPAQWESRLPGVQLARSGDWWMKQVDPNANALMRWWGQSSIGAQSRALGDLGGLATPHAYVDGVLYTKDVGGTLPDGLRLLDPLARTMYLQGSLQMGTFFNDIQPRNMGANGVIFDPAVDPVTKTLFIGGVVGIGLGSAYEMTRP